MGITFDIAHPVPELRVGLCLRAEPFQFRSQLLGLCPGRFQRLPGSLLLFQLGAGLVELRLGFLPQGSLRVQPGLQLPELGPKALRLRLQALIFLLQLILALRRLLGSLLDIVDHVLLVKSAERNGFKGIIFHGPVLSFLLIGDDPTLTQKSSIDKGLKNKKKIQKKVLHFKSRRAIINKLSDRTCALSSAG